MKDGMHRDGFKGRRDILENQWEILQRILKQRTGRLYGECTPYYPGWLEDQDFHLIGLKTSRSEAAKRGRNGHRREPVRKRDAEHRHVVSRQRVAFPNTHGTHVQRFHSLRQASRWQVSTIKICWPCCRIPAVMDFARALAILCRQSAADRSGSSYYQSIYMNCSCCSPASPSPTSPSLSSLSSPFTAT